MNPDPTLFDRPRSRATDPWPSDAAEDGHRKSGKMGRNVGLVVKWVHLHPGCTATELWACPQNHRVNRHEVSRRLSDAMHAGLVRQGEKRRCSVKGTLMVTWWPVTEKRDEADTDEG